MAMAGVTFSTLVREVWAPELKATHWLNNWLFDQSLFRIEPALGGTSISNGYEYSVSSNVGTYNYDDAMVDPYTSNQVRAYFNKDHYQEAVRVFNVYKDYLSNGGSEAAALNYAKKALETGVLNLRDKITTTVLADLESQVDSSSAYSDGSLSRTTYASLKSYEEATTAALSLAYVEDLVEALMTHTTYGQGVRSETDLVILLPRNQLTNFSRLVTGQAYNASFFQMVTSTQDMGPADAGRVFRTKTFEGIDLVSVPDMTTTTLLCLHKPDVAIKETRPFTVTPKTEAADTELWQLTAAYNGIAESPGNHGKLSNKTA